MREVILSVLVICCAVAFGSFLLGVKNTPGGEQLGQRERRTSTLFGDIGRTRTSLQVRLSFHRRIPNRCRSWRTNPTTIAQMNDNVLDD